MKYDPLNITNFPADLKKRLKASAKKSYRSLTQEIIFALEQYLKREQTEPTK